jgi:PAS domain S-box-containing protein
MAEDSTTRATTADLRRRAEARLRQRRKHQMSKAAAPKSEAGARRLLHELQVYQVELEMQNVELQAARDHAEALLEKYTDLYDFAPVGYFSLDEQGRILEANLTGAALLGIERSRLLNWRLSQCMAPASQPIFRAFLERVFAGTDKQFCEVALSRQGAVEFWASFRGIAAISGGGERRWCRVAVSDITFRKQAEEAQRRVEVMAAANLKLKQEIVQRHAVEKSLRTSEQHQSELLEQSRDMHDQLRFLSRRLLLAQEEERRRISRELHDVIAQTLTGINVRLANLKKEALIKPKGLGRTITHTQRLVEQSVEVVHRFARELRPAVLDDLGLIPALHTHMKSFHEQTGIHVSLSAVAKVEQIESDARTALYRVAQEALTNIARHAQASHAEVALQILDGVLCMTIKDNGRGFEQVQGVPAKKSKRLGLLGMRERLEMLGGSVTISSVPGKGTTVTAQLPQTNAEPKL